MMTDDMELLRQYVRHDSEDAFAALVSRHVNLVYSVALRRVRDPHQAEEITQVVFIILARKAALLGPRTILPGWLCRTAWYTAARALTIQQRRQHREQEACMQAALNEPESGAWLQIAPLLDEAMARLGEKDHHAIVLRYFEGRDLKEVGAALGTGEDTARMRVKRAVEKLRRFFSKRGIALSTAVIAGAVSAHSVQAAPAGLAKAATAIAFTKGASAGASTLTLIKGALKLMAWAHAKTAIIAGLAGVLAVTTAAVVVTNAESPKLDDYLQKPELNDISNAPPMVEIQPTHFATTFPIGRPGTILGRTAGTREIGRNIDLTTTILKAYRYPSLARVVFPADFARVRVDYLVTVPDRPYERFQEEIKRKFGWTAHVETRETDVLLLKLNHANAPGLTPADGSSAEEWFAKHPQKEGIYRHAITASQFSMLIEGLVQKPVIDRTGLVGKYDFVVGPFGPEEINNVFLDQLGLELVSAREPIEMLVVEKVK